MLAKWKLWVTKCVLLVGNSRRAWDETKIQLKFDFLQTASPFFHLQQNVFAVLLQCYVLHFSTFCNYLTHCYHKE